jgi:hypothetical protein
LTHIPLSETLTKEEISSSKQLFIPVLQKDGI